MGLVDGFLGFQSPGYIDALTPPLVLAIVFGLSMDYEVFLLSRDPRALAATGDRAAPSPRACGQRRARSRARR